MHQLWPQIHMGANPDPRQCSATWTSDFSSGAAISWPAEREVHGTCLVLLREWRVIIYAKHLACELAFLSHTVTRNDSPTSSVGHGEIIPLPGRSGGPGEQPGNL